MKHWKGVAVWVIIVITLGLLVFGAIGIIANFTKPRTTVSIGGAAFKVGIAQTEKEWEQGLLSTDHLSDGQGLLFVFHSDGPQNISTENMKYDTDLVWLSVNKKVVNVERDAKAHDTAPHASKTPARYVLQIPAGSAARAQIMTGTIASFDLPE